MNTSIFCTSGLLVKGKILNIEMFLCQVMLPGKHICYTSNYTSFHNATLDYITLSDYPRWYYVYLPEYIMN